MVAHSKQRSINKDDSKEKPAINMEGPNLFDEVVERLKKKSEERLRYLEQQGQLPLAAIEALKLPIWGDSKRGIPNEVVRSSLFSIKPHYIPRQFYKNKGIATIGDNCNIFYSGEDLRQDDCTVWLQLMHVGKEITLGDGVEVNYHQFLKALDWPTNDGGYDRLQKSFERMKVSSLTIHSERISTKYPQFKDRGISISLIRKIEYATEIFKNGKTSRKAIIYFEPEVYYLFGSVYFSKIDWDTRKKLKPLAQWLHNMYQSHAKPYPLKVQTIFEACGSGAALLKNFRVDLRSSLKQLVTVGFLTSWDIDKNDLVSVVRAKQNPKLN